MSEQFQVGDTVEWSSQAAGSTKTKLGQIVEVVHANAKPTRNVKGIGSARTDVSYVVEVKRPKSVKYYWPRVSALKKASS